MIGCPDLLAFTSETNFSETSTDLPEELSLTYPEFISPWSSRSTRRFNRDFILISEFSEQVGPQPLLTIPDNTGSHGSLETFDLNQFSVRIMSADYQTILASPGTYGHPRLNFVEDSAVVLEYPQEGAFSYVHYLTLYDLEARGFVRPFCVAYVSSEERKIMQNFCRLSREFSKASECLKTGNRKNFANEIEKRLADLEFTRLVLLREISTGQERNVEQVAMVNEVVDNTKTSLKKKVKYDNTVPEANCCKLESNSEIWKEFKNLKLTTEGQKKAAEIVSLEKAIQEHKSLLKEVASFPNRKLRNRTFLPYDSDHVPLSLECHWDIEVQTPELMLESHSCLHIPQLVSSKSSKCFNKHLKNLEELCDEYFLQQTLKQLRATEKSFRGDATYHLSQNLTLNLLRHLNSTNFLFEYPPKNESKVQSAQTQSYPPQASSVSHESYISCVEMVPIKLESSVLPAFLLTPNKEETLQAPMKDSVSSGESIEVLQTEKSFKTPGCQYAMETVPQSSTCSPSIPEVRKRRVTTRRENSEDSIEVLSTTDSIIPDDFRASYFSAIHEELLEHQDEPSEDTIPIKAQYNTQDSNPEKDSDLNYQHFHPISRMNSFQLPPDQYTGCTSLASRFLDISSFLDLNGKVKAGRSRRARARSGRAMLQFLQRFPFAIHAVFSLLTGRTLVILGDEEAEVRHWVMALEICTPQLGRERTSVQPWTSEPLQITDLLSWKLIGFNRMSSPSSGTPPCLTRYARYLSVLDVDQRTLQCPSYQGTLICPLVEPSTYILGGTSYFLYAQSLISELVSKVFVLTFSHSLRSASNPASKDRPSRFLCRFHQDDLKIMHFLSDVVTRHVTGSSSMLLWCSYSASNVFKL